MTVSTPNTSTSGTVGTPSPAAIATRSLDASQSPAAADHVQLVDLVDRFAAYMAMIAQALSLSVDPGTGRLRMLLESYGTPANNANMTGSGFPITASAANVAVTVASISNTGGAGNKPDTLIFDAMQNAWANSAGLFVSRS